MAETVTHCHILSFPLSLSLSQGHPGEFFFPLLRFSLSLPPLGVGERENFQAKGDFQRVNPTGTGPCGCKRGRKCHSLPFSLFLPFSGVDIRRENALSRACRGGCNGQSFTEGGWLRCSEVLQLSPCILCFEPG
jgi:hypothetical protein